MIWSSCIFHKDLSKFPKMLFKFNQSVFLYLYVVWTLLSISIFEDRSIQLKMITIWQPTQIIFLCRTSQIFLDKLITKEWCNIDSSKKNSLQVLNSEIFLLLDWLLCQGKRAQHALFFTNNWKEENNSCLSFEHYHEVKYKQLHSEFELRSSSQYCCSILVKVKELFGGTDVAAKLFRASCCANNNAVCLQTNIVKAYVHGHRVGRFHLT